MTKNAAWIKELEKKDCLDCMLCLNGICDVYGAINKPVLLIDCKESILRIKGN